jgi:NDP-sugar pyrophosphorylase family protein
MSTKRLFINIPDIMKNLFEHAEYPWEILDNIGKHIVSSYNDYIKQGYIEYKPGVLIGNGTFIADSAYIEAPAIIGHNCELRHGAFIRGNVVTGEACVIGNSTEVKNSILMDHVQIPHFNYVGDAILGNRAHFGAGAICSNVRQDKTEIKIKTDPPITTGRVKLSAIICDDVEIGSGSVINPGSVICRSSRIYPLTSVRGIIPSNCIVKSSGEIVPIK